MPAPRPPLPPPPPGSLPIVSPEPDPEPVETLRERLEREAGASTEGAARAALFVALAEIVWGETKDEDATLPHLERAFEADPTFVPALDPLFRIHRRRDDRDSLARVARARARAADPGRARSEALADLAETLEDLVADPAGADEAWAA